MPASSSPTAVSAPVVDYHFAVLSPWVWLGHDRLVEIADRHGALVRLHPIDLSAMGAHGFVPLGQRPQARRDYRLIELARWRDHLGKPLVLQPKHFPVPADLAARMILAAQAEADARAVAAGRAADPAAGRPALALLGRIGRAVWADELDVSDPAVLVRLAADCGLDGARLLAAAPAMAEAAAACTRQALEQGVFGVPWYVVDGEPFWGQDRLDFVDLALARHVAGPHAR